MKVKLMDRDDIRRYGATVVEIADHIGNDLISRNRAVRMDVQKEAPRKGFMFPPSNKAMWTPPEEKAMQQVKSHIIAGNEKKPKKGDSLFPRSIIS